jgi:hypothetical protein
MDQAEEGQNRDLYFDPTEVAGVVIGCLAGAGVLFWLLWALLVCPDRRVNAGALVLGVVLLWGLRRAFIKCERDLAP